MRLAGRLAAAAARAGAHDARLQAQAGELRAARVRTCRGKERGKKKGKLFRVDPRCRWKRSSLWEHVQKNGRDA